VSAVFASGFPSKGSFFLETARGAVLDGPIFLIPCFAKTPQGFRPFLLSVFVREYSQPSHGRFFWGTILPRSTSLPCRPGSVSALVSQPTLRFRFVSLFLVFAIFFYTPSPLSHWSRGGILVTAFPALILEPIVRERPIPRSPQHRPLRVLR